MFADPINLAVFEAKTVLLHVTHLGIDTFQIISLGDLSVR